MRGALADRMILVCWLVLVWVLLWGSVSPLVLLSAAVVAPACLAVSRLPALTFAARPRPLRVLGAIARFLRDLVTSSAEVAWATMRHGPRTRSAIVALPVHRPSDVTLTLIANRLSLEPGTLVVDVDRDSDTLFVHVLDVRSEADIDRRRRDARRAATDVVRAVGEETATDRAPSRGGSEP